MKRSKTDLLNFDLYPVTCRNLSRGRSNLEVLEGLIAGGAKAVQLRDKELSDGEFLLMAQHFRRRTLEAGMTLIINDRVDVCLAVDADGVHLGQDDFPIPDARKLLGSDKIIGASTHSVAEALLAVQQGADYINIGPIFATQTKEHLAGPVGVELYLEAKETVSEYFKMQIANCKMQNEEEKIEECRLTSPRPEEGSKTEDMTEHVPPLQIDFPITVMGGINLSNINEVLRAGARRIAVVSAVVGAEDVAEAVGQLRRMVAQASLPVSIATPDTKSVAQASLPVSIATPDMKSVAQASLPVSIATPDMKSVAQASLPVSIAAPDITSVAQASLPVSIHEFNSASAQKDGFIIYRRNLPHWRTTGSIYFVTWHLAKNQYPLTSPERQLILASVRHFDNARYRLYGCVMMDDHVHAIIQPQNNYSLASILHSWKSYTANQFQRNFGRQGVIWQDESFDRIIRDEAEYHEKMQYMWNNPFKRWPNISEYPWIWFSGMKEL